jgi:2-iminobutanoate/2-iminopropanoate deaminase
MTLIVTYPGLSGNLNPMGPAPLSSARWAGDTLYISGQVGIDPATGAIVGPGVAEQTRQALINFRSLVEAAGMTMSDVAKTTLFLVDLNAFAQVNAIYREFFTAPYPARSTVGIVLTPSSLLFEIEGVVVRPRAAS